MRDFATDLAEEQQDTTLPEIPKLVRLLFPLATKLKRCRDVEQQRRGIDLWVDNETIDLKIRKKAYSDIALEFTHEFDDGRAIVGWVADKTKINTYVMYVFKEDWSAWLLSTARLQLGWDAYSEEWKTIYPIIRSRNKDYWTYCCCVPVEEILKIGEVRYAKL